MATASEARWFTVLTPRYLGPTVTLCLGVALLAFNGFLAATALPSAVVDLKGVALMSWATTVFLVFAIMGGTAAAIVKTRLGARMALLVAALVFIAGSLLAALAGGMPELLVGRALQGLGEGVVAAICYALIPELYPSKLVPRVFGAESVVWALAAFGGPALAGVLTETISWRAAFMVNIPLGLIFIALTLMVVPRRVEAGNVDRLPMVRLVLIGAAIMAISVAAVLRDPLPTALCLALAGAGLVAIVRRDAGAREKLFPTGAFRLNDTVGAGLWVVLLMPVAQAGIAVYLVYALQNLWDFGATLAGAINAVMAVAWSTMAIAISGVASVPGRHALIRLGPVFLTAGLAALALGVADQALWLVITGQVLLGFGFGASWAYLSQTIMESARPGERDRASGLLPTIQSAGYGIGAAIAGLIANMAGLAAAQTAGDIRAAMIVVFASGIAIGILAILAARITVRNARRLLATA
ncbi:MFS transporter [Pelagibacterium xiamenense]|uniref:MFS transporter n=1 Tax=Pelagibacterium xiamenense TaxID=2901140 RepID=UPI001E40A152|nr:MFS transporter [Pelagibacterium xiamenense]MCD7058476.1 MFS transporter [Pelagibacterium xiamenense]